MKIYFVVEVLTCGASVCIDMYAQTARTIEAFEAGRADMFLSSGLSNLLVASFVRRTLLGRFRRRWSGNWE